MVTRGEVEQPCGIRFSWRCWPDSECPKVYPDPEIPLVLCKLFHLIEVSKSANINQ